MGAIYYTDSLHSADQSQCLNPIHDPTSLFAIENNTLNNCDRLMYQDPFEYNNPIVENSGYYGIRNYSQFEIPPSYHYPFVSNEESSSWNPNYGKPLNSSPSQFYDSPQQLQSFAVSFPPSRPSNKITKKSEKVAKVRKTSKMHQNTCCSNCGISETTLWRRSEIGLPECNACNTYERVKGHKRPAELWNKPTMKRRRRPLAKVEQKTLCGEGFN
uniref:GATA-type domain-containing protein n=1 Tax=Caenorhabditis japonica TaxID=281687 RepID=A0A8R1HUU1_CAEJA